MVVPPVFRTSGAVYSSSHFEILVENSEFTNNSALLFGAGL